ncbi:MULTISPECIES: DUF4190 domain-containing protein [unclassified Streptomyces]|uniref:DUF4190 domain-containing protein n=1 Tax=unclassified Streptomyces TaxID=2593676 RepID=UPI00278BC7BF|nr:MULTISPECIES: DUF4190 domain-containing protein [unclassified Streptomyces]
MTERDDPWRLPPAPSSYGYVNPYAAPDEPVPPPPVGPEGPGPLPPHPAYGYGPYGYGQPYGYGPAPIAPPRNGLGVAALVLGIVTAVGFLAWPVAIVTGVLAVVFGTVGRRRAGRGAASNGGQALAGLICGVGGLLSAVGVAIAVLG